MLGGVFEVGQLELLNFSSIQLFFLDVLVSIKRSWAEIAFEGCKLLNFIIIFFPASVSYGPNSPCICLSVNLNRIALSDGYFRDIKVNIVAGHDMRSEVVQLVMLVSLNGYVVAQLVKLGSLNGYVVAQLVKLVSLHGYVVAHLVKLVSLNGYVVAQLIKLGSLHGYVLAQLVKVWSLHGYVVAHLVNLMSLHG